MADPSGNGEGATFLGSLSSGVGPFSFTFTPLVPVAPGDNVTATATHPDRNTSEFAIAEEATATTFTVTNASDADDGTCAAHCTLREAINARNPMRRPLR